MFAQKALKYNDPGSLCNNIIVYYTSGSPEVNNPSCLEAAGADPLGPITDW